MKKFLSVLLIFISGMLCAQAGPEIRFTETKYNFGFIRQGEKATFEYKFRNSGDVPVIINDIKVECGCTIPEKPTEPILPGKEGVIRVTFDSANKMDRQERKIKVISNDGEHILVFKGVVLKAKK